VELDYTALLVSLDLPHFFDYPVYLVVGKLIIGIEVLFHKRVFLE
jgi:hypothetical protein